MLIGILIGLVVGILGASGFWILRYNDVKFNLSLEQSISEGLAQSLDDVAVRSKLKK